MQNHRIGMFSIGGAAMDEFLAQALRIARPRDHFREDILQCARTEFNAQDIRSRLWQAWGLKPQPAIV